ncbi:MAG: hypothetical protein M3N57_10875 [Actinomycetota bacterium]|nr:hypothetical protein [Actinomycetota bacterium]
MSDPVADPATHTLGSGSFDAASTGFATGALPTVTVTDNRNPTLGGWTVAVGATQFKSATNQAGTTTPLHTIAGSNVSYWSGAATVASGTVVAAGQQLAETGAVTLSQSRDAVVATGAVGNNSVTFTPSLKVNISGVPVDTYTGVITHSVTGS